MRGRALFCVAVCSCALLCVAVRCYTLLLCIAARCWALRAIAVHCCALVIVGVCCCALTCASVRGCVTIVFWWCLLSVNFVCRSCVCWLCLGCGSVLLCPAKSVLAQRKIPNWRRAGLIFCFGLVITRTCHG